MTLKAPHLSMNFYVHRFKMQMQIKDLFRNYDLIRFL
jgi:hypothetical protein